MSKMNLKQAYEYLELPSTATAEEVKKQYRKLTKLYHPDINKEPGAEDKFKKINQAYNRVSSGESDDYADQFSGFPFEQKMYKMENIRVELTLSFKESVLGCKKDIKFSRNSKCKTCNGSGEIFKNNGCKKCGGKGQTVVRQGNMMMVKTCTDCLGKDSSQNCSVCNSQGTLNSDMSVSLNIPAGIVNDKVLKLQNMGNYAGSFMGFADQYTDVLCHIKVIPEEGLSLKENDQDVISHLTIPLIEALSGSKHIVKTIFGDKEIEVVPKSRHCDAILIPKCGVAGIGNQKVILNVEYPQDITTLLEVLQQSNHKGD